MDLRKIQLAGSGIFCRFYLGLPSVPSRKEFTKPGFRFRAFAAPRFGAGLRSRRRVSGPLATGFLLLVAGHWPLAFSQKPEAGSQ
jgi:hypothetical protein